MKILTCMTANPMSGTIVQEVPVPGFSTSCPATMNSGLSHTAIAFIEDLILHPLLENPRFQDFESVVLNISPQITDKALMCIRDVELDLRFKAMVSKLQSSVSVEAITYSLLCI